MNLAYAIILLLLAIGGVVVRKTYYYLPAHELKRRAERGDSQAAKLYQAVAYGGSLRALLWLYISLVTAGSLVLLARRLPVWVSLLIVGPVLWAAFSWLPSSRRTKFGSSLTLMATPAIVLVLTYLHPLLSRGTDAVQKHTSAVNHTGLFERGDLIKLIEEQQWQSDNRIPDEELEIAKRALSFDDYKVADILTPRKKVKTVLATDTVGPVLIDDLHKSGQPYILVKDKKGGMVVGTLRFSKLGLDSQGRVSDLMDRDVYYLHDQDRLSEALHAFFVTNHSLFVVVNSFEEFVGIISIENILKHLLGHVPGSDFSQYADPAAVARRKTPIKTDNEMIK